MSRTKKNPVVYPVILSGGSGTRLWPLSRELYPKQLLDLIGKKSLMQETLLRVKDKKRFAPPLVVCNDEHRFMVAEQCRQVKITPQDIVLEPLARNTAPAVAVAALLLTAKDPHALMLVLPSDHVIAKKAAFNRAVAIAARAARSGALVTFGIKPVRPETGYGYICKGASRKDVAGSFLIERFVEKPDTQTAKTYFRSGKWLWNSGMFLFSARKYIAELSRLEPAMMAACRATVKAMAHDLDFIRLDKKSFAKSPSKSIDYAVMEKTAHAAVVPASLGWSDVGSFDALWELEAKDKKGNAVIGDVVAEDTTRSYLRSDKGLLAVIGLSDIVVVAHDDAVLVAPKNRSQDIRKIVARLKESRRREPVSHTTVYRPWGSYQSVDAGREFQVKRITVNPGARLSLQKHRYRAEHWVVVEGRAKVRRGTKSFILRKNESTFIPAGTVHCLENPGKTPLHLIEVQSGSYLGEDDIIRLDDLYGRR